MKYIKIYENLNDREINIHDLFKIYMSNKSDFFEYQRWKSDVFNFNLILSEIFEDQKISFFGSTFNNRNSRNIEAVVNQVFLWGSGGSPFSMEFILSECSENFYKDTKFYVDIDIPITIYSKQSEVEERFHVLKNLKKYNL